MSFIVSNTYDIHATASLDLQFASKKNLIDQISGSNLVDFTRQSRATYVDGDGVIRTATTNLLLRSEEFDQSPWGTINATVTADATTSPNGTVTADLISDNGSTPARVRQQVSVSAGQTYTASIYLKAGSQDSVSWREDNEDSLGLNVNLTTGEVTGGSGNIEPAGNGWYRVSFSGSVSSTSFWPEVRLTSPGTVYAWGAQLEQSTTVGEYIPTTSTINSAPRFDHDPTTGESLGLLVEESRINYVTQSESFSGWSVQQLTKSTASDVVAPDGTTGNVRLFTEDETSNVHRLFIAPSVGGATDRAHTIFVKVASGTRRIYLSSDNSSGTRRTLIFDLANETYDNTTDGIEDWSNITIQAHPNGWYRIGAVIEDDGVGSTLHIWGTVPDDSDTISFQGDGTSGFYLWGAQLEEGSFPTRYIPTTTAEATRAADVASISGSNFSSWYRQDEGTVFARASSPVASSIFAVDDGSAGNRIIPSFLNTTTSPSFRVVTGGSDQANFSPGSITAGAVFSQASAYKANDFATALDGGTAAVDTSGIVSTGMTSARIGANVAGVTIINGTIRRLTYWPARLPNDTLQTITV